MFWRKNKGMTTEEYADLLTKFTTLQGEIAILKNEVAALRTYMNSVRGLVNRKLGKGGFDDDEERVREFFGGNLPQG